MQTYKHTNIHIYKYTNIQTENNPNNYKLSNTTNITLAAAHSLILHHHRCTSRSALNNPTPPPMLLFLPFKIMSTHPTSFLIGHYANNYKLFSTPNNILAAAHSLILHNPQCPCRSALTNPTPPPPLLF